MQGELCSMNQSTPAELWEWKNYPKDQKLIGQMIPSGIDIL
jgi:hypothetical protein